MKNKTPVKSIRNYCLECCNMSRSEVAKCAIVECHLFVYRLGKNPNRLGIGRKLENQSRVGGSYKIKKIFREVDL